MGLITFNIENNYITCDTTYLISDNTDYKAKAVFDKEWDGNAYITWLFVYEDKTFKQYICSKTDTISIPKINGTPYIYVGCVSGDQRTTNHVALRVIQSVTELADEERPEIESDAYDELMDILDEQDSRLDALESTITDKYTKAQTDTLLNGKVDKVTGKGLSSNDYTNSDKSKVSNIPDDPKYTDTVYDDTDIKNDLEELETAVEGKASTESVQNLNSSKLSKPTSGIEVGKYFRVASIDELGNPVLEACDLPIASIVKSGMTSNTDPAWTASEQLSARQRMGMDKEWVLKGEIVGDETDRGKIDTGVSVDLSGCTELRIIGTATATGNVSIFTSGSALTYNAFTTSRKVVYGVWTSTDIGIDCTVCKYSTSASAQIIADNMSGYCWTNNKKVKDITKILFNTPANITSCDVKIYAR